MILAAAYRAAGRGGLYPKCRGAGHSPITQVQTCHYEWHLLCLAGVAHLPVAYIRPPKDRPAVIGWAAYWHMYRKVSLLRYRVCVDVVLKLIALCTQPGTLVVPMYVCTTRCLVAQGLQLQKRMLAMPCSRKCAQACQSTASLKCHL